jgi:hypothetical protein
VQQVGTVLDDVLQVALRLHAQNRTAVERKGPLPEAEARRASARADQRRLQQARERLAKVEADKLVAQHALEPYSYDLTKSAASTRDTFQARSELRNVLRQMDPKARAQALAESQDFRRAALELPGQASGLQSADYASLYRAEIAQRFPDELSQLADAEAALAAAKATLATVEQALTNELQAVGAPVAEPAAPAPATDF